MNGGKIARMITLAKLTGTRDGTGAQVNLLFTISIFLWNSDLCVVEIFQNTFPHWFPA